MIDILASEYGWNISEIEDLTYLRIKGLLNAILKRQKQEEYLQRLHIGMQAMAIVRALNAAMDGKEIKIDELIGKAPEEDNGNKIDEWKRQAKNKGLKTGN